MMQLDFQQISVSGLNNIDDSFCEKNVEIFQNVLFLDRSYVKVYLFYWIVGGVN